MSDAVEMAERHGRTLARLSELGLALAERAQERALAAMDREEPKAAADFSLVFHRISRNVRQSIALEARLVRDAARAAREDAAEAERRRTAILRDPAAMVRRKGAVQEAIERVIWNEREGEEADYLLELLETRLTVGGFDDDFLLEPLEDHIARLCADLGCRCPTRPPRSSRPASPRRRHPPPGARPTPRSPDPPPRSSSSGRAKTRSGGPKPTWPSCTGSPGSACGCPEDDERADANHSRHPGAAQRRPWTQGV